MNCGKIVVMAGCMLLGGLSIAKADSFSLYLSNYSYGNGSEAAGEFTAYASDNFLANYATVATLNGGFETFCVQPNVFINTGTNYSYTLGQQDGAGQSLSLGTAFLYYEFGTGALAGYNYTNPGDRLADAGELQAAIWALQNQTAPNGWPSLSGDTFYQLAISEFGSLSNALVANNGTYGVDILDLTGDNGAPAQNQLAIVSSVHPHAVPTPEAGATSTMIIFALGVFMLMRRQIRQYGFARS